MQKLLCDGPLEDREEGETVNSVSNSVVVGLTLRQRYVEDPGAPPTMMLLEVVEPLLQFLL